MTRQEYADAFVGALRPLMPGAKFVSEEVGLINQLAHLAAERAGKMSLVPAMTALKEPAAFYDVIRKGLFGGAMTTAQFAGIEAKLKAMGAAAWPIAYVAYGLATSYWETARTMQPIEEYGKGKGRKYGVAGNHGQIAYGRGDVQLTWDYNYERADEELGLNGALIANYALALNPDISARIMVGGMSEGWFTGKKLADYLPRSGAASLEQFQGARRIINGTDKAPEIAKIAATFQSGLVAGGWA